MTETVGDWRALVDGIYPESGAESWDAVGLQVGDPEDPVTAVLVCLDVTQATLAEASARSAELVVAHHPLLLRPLERLTPSTAPGRLALQAARGGLSVLAAHTNFDVAAAGTSDPIVAVLGLVDVASLRPASPLERAKLVTFVPTESVTAVLQAAANAGAGVIGEYSECSFRVEGVGTFRPSAAAAPAVGARGRRNEVAEQRLEVVVPRTRLHAVVAAIVAAHPYEEVAWDAYPLLFPQPAGEEVKGLGRVGDLPEPLALRDLADRLTQALPAPHLRVAGDLDREIHRVAACGGAGDSLVPAALAAEADVFVTGDLRHHVALDALTQGMAVVDAGHYATEAAALPSLVDALRQAASERGLSARLLASETVTEPWAAYRPAGVESKGAS